MKNNRPAYTKVRLSKTRAQLLSDHRKGKGIHSTLAELTRSNRRLWRWDYPGNKLGHDEKIALYNIGISLKQWTMLRNNSSIITGDELVRIALLLNVSVDDLLLFNADTDKIRRAYKIKPS